MGHTIPTRWNSSDISFIPLNVFIFLLLFNCMVNAQGPPVEVALSNVTVISSSGCANPTCLQTLVSTTRNSGCQFATTGNIVFDLGKYRTMYNWYFNSAWGDAPRLMPAMTLACSNSSTNFSGTDAYVMWKQSDGVLVPVSYNPGATVYIPLSVNPNIVLRYCSMSWSNAPYNNWLLYGTYWSDFFCIPGAYAFSSAQCFQCLANTYNDGTLSRWCYSCPPNTISGSGSTSASACNVACALGTYSSTRTPPCTNCSALTYTTGTGSTTCLSCVSCPAGQYYSSACSSLTASPGTCATCSFRVNYCPAGSTAPIPCTSCTPGNWTNALCSTSSDTQCIPCPAGSYCSNPTTQNFCTAGSTYCPTGVTGPLTCTVCATGYYSVSACNTTTNTQCKPCSVCSIGTYRTSICTSTNDTRCAPCSAGISYSPSSNASTCIPCSVCPAGTYRTLQCTLSTDTVCVPCDAGINYNPSSNASACIPCGACAVGQYLIAACNTTANIVCAACPAGSYDASGGGSNSTACTPCNLGTYGPSSGLTMCTPCNVGTFAPSSGLAACFNCTTGAFLPDPAPAPPLHPSCSSLTIPRTRNTPL